MRIGLIGLGRIGAFHADTLAALDAVDELVVTDPFAAAVDAVTARHPRVRPVESPADLLASGVDGVRQTKLPDEHSTRVADTGSAVDTGKGGGHGEGRWTPGRAADTRPGGRDDKRCLSC